MIMGLKDTDTIYKTVFISQCICQKINSNNEMCRGALEEYNMKNIRKRDGKDIVIVKEKYLRCQMRGY